MLPSTLVFPYPNGFYLTDEECKFSCDETVFVVLKVFI